jgi:dTDP-glucose 4,6-dehydratase
MINILVTGGCGFIGSHFIEHLFNESSVSSIINIDCLTYASSQNNIPSSIQQNSRYHFYPIDIRDFNSILPLFKKHHLTHVVNLAAETHVDRSIQSATDFASTNIIGTLNLLDAAKSYWKNANPLRFLQVSTDEVYGTISAPHRFTEDSPLLPNSPYAASKASADLLLRSYIQTHSFPAIISRCCNNYGPRQHSEKWIPTILNSLHHSIPIPVYGNGLQSREWLAVKHHCHALWQILTQGRLGEIYNIGSGLEMTNLQLIHSICTEYEIIHSLPPHSTSRLIQHITDRPGHDLRYALSSNKIKQETDWSPKNNFNHEIQLLIKNLSSHKTLHL